MKKIEILDCTLRDGAQVNSARFGVNAVKDIIQNLTDAKIDIVECGFLKDINFEEGRTYYPQPSFSKKYIPINRQNSKYAALVDFNRFDVNKLEDYDGSSFDIIRISFFEKDVHNVKDFCEIVKGKGYAITMQPMDTYSYTAENLDYLLSIANDIKPLAISIVDTYAIATYDDVDRVYKYYEKNLNKNIKIGFHSHNNQLNSYALAEYFINISNKDRDIIVDSSLYGMGRGGGNLNTELFIEHLNRKGLKSYNVKPILDSIDKYMIEFKKNYEWGYSIPMLYAGLYGVHVHTVAYLESKPNITSYDLKNIFEMLDNEKKKRYDYDYLDLIYEQYMSKKKGFEIK